MVRSAAKNFDSVIIVTDVADYDLVLNNLKNNTNTVEFRRDLMIKAYEHTASYDSMIANYMNKRFNNGFGSKQFIVGTKYLIQDMERILIKVLYMSLNLNFQINSK